MKLKISPGLNLSLYSLLLIVTPFLMLMNYLQEAIGSISRAHFILIGAEIPYVVMLATLGLVAVIAFTIRKINTKKLFGIALVVVLLIAGQKISDYYFNHKFYDLQHNWHYIAYGIFAYLAYLKFSDKQLPPEKIILRTFLYAFCISLFDEVIQVYISNRVFDLSDVGKDMWGVLVGQCFVQFVLLNGVFMKPVAIRQKKLSNYVKQPFTLLFHQAVFTLVLLQVSSTLSDAALWPYVFLIAIPAYLIIWLGIHAGNQLVMRWLLRFVFAFLLVYVTYAQFSGNAPVKRITDSVIVYKGIPFVYFDLMIYQNGSFRIVDKKTSFNMRDKQKIHHIDPGILLIGTGSKSQGGKGFNEQKLFEFNANYFHSKIFQVIRLPNKDAIKTYNRLIRENKQVLFIIHNS